MGVLFLLRFTFQSCQEILDFKIKYLAVFLLLSTMLNFFFIFKFETCRVYFKTVWLISLTFQLLDLKLSKLDHFSGSFEWIVKLMCELRRVAVFFFGQTSKTKLISYTLQVHKLVKK